LNKKHVKQEGGTEFMTEFLISTEMADLPPYYLKLNNKTLIIPILNISEGLGIGKHTFK
jgi:hypothetical protein